MWAHKNLTGRFGIPKHGDDEELPLAPAEVDELRRAFDVTVDVSELFFVQLGSIYLLRSRLLRQAERADTWLHERVPRMRRYSYRQNILLRALPTA
jgi:hypothetical protein